MSKEGKIESRNIRGTPVVKYTESTFVNPGECSYLNAALSAFVPTSPMNVTTLPTKIIIEDRQDSSSCSPQYHNHAYAKR